jgi:hypothetical protein
VAVVAAGALALPSAALAGTLTVDHTAHTATYQAGAGEANKLSFYKLSNTYRIQDTGVSEVPLTEIGGMLCTQGEPWKYRCPGASVTTASVALGDGADSFDGSVSSIAFTVSAGADAKTITTGSGADTINAQNGSIDQISCGEGADVVNADANDAVDPSCEKVTLPGGGDGTSQTNGSTGGGNDSPNGSGAGNVFQTPLGLTVALNHVPISNYNARLKLTCAANADQGCRGDVVLELPPAAKKHARHNRAVAARGQYVARQRRRNRRLGKRSYRIDPGEKATIAMPIRARGHYRYVSRRRRSRALLRITERDPQGKVVDVQTRSVTLTSKRGQR